MKIVGDKLHLEGAMVTVRHFDGHGVLKHEDVIHNLVTVVGLDWLHNQGWGTTGLSTNGLNYVAVSNDPVTETSASTTLSNEITVNGLTRAQGTVTHVGGSTLTTVSHTFTCATAAQAAQKAALFTDASGGTMSHVVGFVQRPLEVGDQLELIFDITLA